MNATDVTSSDCENHRLSLNGLLLLQKQKIFVNLSDINLQVKR